MATLPSVVPVGSGVDWDHAIKIYINTWLHELGTAIVAEARKLNKNPQVSIWHFTAAHYLYINAEGPRTDYPHPDLSQWALDFTFTVPADGYKPPQGNKAIHMSKWEGEKFVATTYSNFKGQTITRKGFLSEAIRKQLTVARLNNLGFGLAILIGHKVADSIATEARKHGAVVTVT